jgi:O-acetyl-ADP-ribose deacetylase (regulator of RNase III)
MIVPKNGDLLRADAEALVNSVNCVGVMGRGVALQFRKAFPENYEAYRKVCDRKELRPGTVFVHDLNRLTNPRYVINFPTKEHWKAKSRIEDIETGLGALVREVRARKIRSIAMPPLGCGLGGLRWAKVKPLIEEAFRGVPAVRVLLYQPKWAPPPEEMVKRSKAPSMTVGRAALLALANRYLAAVMDPIVTLLELHKLLYFLQESGEGLKLRYEKATFGPYAENLRHLLNEIEGHFIEGFGDAGDQPSKPIRLDSQASARAEGYLDRYPRTRERFERVVRLIAGFETPFGMELLATVHWVAKYEEAETAEEAVAKTYAWNNRKRMFQETHIRKAWERLERQGWLE